MRVLSFFAEEGPFWPLGGAKSGRCGGLMERERNPWLLSHYPPYCQRGPFIGSCQKAPSHPLHLI